MIEIDDIVFTKSQEIGVDKITAFMKNNERVFVLTGKAGTGKTTIIKYALESLLQRDRIMAKKYGVLNPDQFDVLGVCLSHKAKENLRVSIPYVNTFASVFGQRQYTTEEGARVFRIDKEALANADCSKKWRVIVFDECSMINLAMLKTIWNNLPYRCKVIFMGDRGQLPPIDEGTIFDIDKDSPVFQLDITDNLKHQLNERVRQTEGNPIIDLSDFVYDQIFGDCDLFKVRNELYKTKIDSNGFGYGFTNGSEMYEVFKGYTNDDMLNTKLLAYKNTTVNAYNNYIRNYIHNYPSAEYIPSEIIYMNNTYYNEDYRLYNSTEHVLISIGESEVHGIPVHEIIVEQGMIFVLMGPKDSYSMKAYYKEYYELKAAKDFENMHSFVDSFADISYGYTLTAYKAQGSTYKNVFIDVADIFGVKPITAKRKLQGLYTAITRASNNVYFIKK